MFTVKQIGKNTPTNHAFESNRRIKDSSRASFVKKKGANTQSCAKWLTTKGKELKLDCDNIIFFTQKTCVITCNNRTIKKKLSAKHSGSQRT